MIPRASRRERGRALVSCLGVLALVGMLAAGSAALRPVAGSTSTSAAARGLAARLRDLQVRAAAQGRSTGIVFPPAGRDEPLRVVVDGDGDGVHRDDVRDGVDPTEPPFTLRRDHAGVVVGPPPWDDVPDVPPRPGTIGPSSRAVRLGAGRAAVFTGDGRARAGSVLITDRRHGLCAIVIHGATARVRVTCYDPASRSWRPARY